MIQENVMFLSRTFWVIYRIRLYYKVHKGFIKAKLTSLLMNIYLYGKIHISTVLQKTRWTEDFKNLYAYQIRKFQLRKIKMLDCRHWQKPVNSWFNCIILYHLKWNVFWTQRVHSRRKSLRIIILNDLLLVKGLIHLLE